MKCPNCGFDNPPDAKFCVRCGTKLSAGTTPSGAAISTGSVLLDPRRTFYVLQEKYWNWGSGDIFDERGQVIGKMKRKILSLRAEIQLTEPNEIVVGKVVKKILSIRQTYDLLTPDGQLVARMNKKLLSLFRPSLWLEDPNGNHLFEAKGNFMGFNFEIKDTSGRKVAQVQMLNKWKEMFLGGSIFDITDKYALQILDPNVDRLQMLSFVIAIDNSVHDKRD